MSKRRAILEAVIERLNRISTDSGFHYNLPEDEPNYGLRSMERLTSFPAVDFFLEDEVDPQYQPDDTVEGDLALAVIGYYRGDDDEDQLAIEDLLGDLTKAMHFDHTLGGLVADFKCTNRSVDPDFEGVDLPRVCLLAFEITYFDDFETF